MLPWRTGPKEHSGPRSGHNIILTLKGQRGHCGSRVEGVVGLTRVGVRAGSVVRAGTENLCLRAERMFDGVDLARVRLV